MNECENCHSENIDVKILGFEDLHNIVKVFICLSCGHQKTKLINIQEQEEANVPG